MATPWYTPSGTPATSAAGSSSAIRAEFLLIETAMDKLIDLASNVNAIVKVNSGGTGMVASTLSDDGAKLTITGDLYFNTPNPEILGNDTNGTLYIGASTTAALGANILLYGDTHATQADDIVFRHDAATILQYDANAATYKWDFQALSIKTTGGISAGASIFATGSTIGTLTLADGSITDSGGTISFGNEALTTTGDIAIGAAAPIDTEKLLVSLGSSGIAAAQIFSTSAAVFENNGDAIVHIAAPTANSSILAFTDGGAGTWNSGAINVSHASGSPNMAFTLNNNTRLNIDSTGRLATGAATALGVEAGSLTVSTGDFKTTPTAADIGDAADELVLTNNGACGMTIASPNTSQGNIYFADDNASAVGYIQFDHSVNEFRLSNNGVAITIDSNQDVGIGETSPGARLEIQDSISTAYSTSITNIPGSSTYDTLVLTNAQATSGTATLMHFFAQGGAGNSAGRFGLLNLSPYGGDSAFVWQLRDSGHTSDTQEKMRLTGQGDLLIGTDGSTPSARLHVKDSATTVARFQYDNADANGANVHIAKNSSTPADNDILGVLQFRGNTDDGAGGKTTDNVTFAQIYTTATNTGDAAKESQITFQTNISNSIGTRLVIKDDVTVNTGNLVIGTSGQGIDFSATSNGTGAGGVNELLNDYEQGTFTPVFADANTAGNTATGTISGIYTKVGRQVTVNIQGSNLVTTSMTAGNSLYIRALPFATINNASLSVGTCTLNTVTVTGEYVVPRAIANTTYMVLREIRTGTTDIDIIVSDLSTGVSDIFITLTYTAADI